MVHGVVRASLGGDYTNQERSMTCVCVNPTISPLQDAAIVDVIGPGEEDWNGCVSQFGALEPQVGVVGGGCMERFWLDYLYNYKVFYYSRAQSLLTTNSSNWGTSLWVTFGSSTTMSHNSSVTWPWLMTI